MGVLSALPIISAGNLCCCLWVVSGGVVAAYLLQQNRPGPIGGGDGALVGLFAGLIGAAIYGALSIPISIALAPFERALLERLSESTGNIPPAFRDYIGSVAGRTLGLVLNIMMMLCAGALFSTLGGLLGSAIFAKPAPPPQVLPPSPPFQ